MKAKRLVSFITATAFLLSSVAPAFAADTTTTTTTDTSKLVVVGKDVKGTKYEVPVAKLAALKVLNGKDGEGNVKPDDTITRAEFAKILVTELNMGSGISNSTTKFKDVPASHWASGYIALATGKGLIKGFPGGTFKPEAPVTYAEAATMVVRMLGYAPAVDEKAWPASYLSKAASIGVTDGVSVKANEAAKRGDVFVIAANALDTDIMEQDDYGTETIYRVKEGKTILSEDFDITIMDSEWVKDQNNDVPITVTKTPRVNLSTLKSNEIEFDSINGTYEVAPSIDPNAYLGQEVEAWIDTDDDYVYYLQGSDDQEVIYDKIDKFTTESNGKIYLDAKDEDYDILNGTYKTKIWANIDGSYDYAQVKDSATWDAANALKAYAGARVKVVLDKNDDVTAMVITDLYPADVMKQDPAFPADPTKQVVDIANPSKSKTYSGIVKAVKAADETIEYFTESNGTTNEDLDGKDYAIVKDGVQAKLEDLAKDDIINVFKDGDEVYIMATSTKVEGKVEKVVTSDDSIASKYDIYIGGKKYEVSKKATLSEDSNKSVDVLEPQDVEDLDGTDVTLYLDANGEARHVSGKTVDGEKAAKIALVTKGALYNKYDDSVTFEAVSETGTDLKFTFDKADVDLNGNEVAAEDDASLTGLQENWEDTLSIEDASTHQYKPTIIEYELDSAGKLKSVDVKYAGNDTNDYKGSATATPDEDDDTLDVDGSSFNIKDDVVIFDALTANNFTKLTADSGNANGIDKAAHLDEAKTTTWASVESKTGLTNVVYKSDEDEIEYLVVTGLTNGGSLGSDSQYGVVKGFGTVSGDKALVILGADGKEVTIKSDYTTSDITSYVYGQTNTVKKGDFIRYEISSDNEVDKVDVLGYMQALIKTDAINDDKGKLDLDKAKMVTVDSSSESFIKGKIKSDNAGAGLDDTVFTTFITNKDTKYFDIHDDGDLKTASGVSYGDLVLIVDTDDDGGTADYVLILKD